MLDHEIVAGIQFIGFAIEHQSHPWDNNNIATGRARDNRADVNVCCCVIECSISRCDCIERSEFLGGHSMLCCHWKTSL